MRRKLTTIYAVICTLLLAAGFLLVFLLSWQKGAWESVECLLGLAISIILSPIYHEIGHVFGAKIANFSCVYVKCFCFTFYRNQGKVKFRFSSPFAPDETQVLPKSGGNMLRRTKWYTVGGLLFGGAFLFLVLGGAIVCTAVGHTSYLLWGMIPYAAYLFLLNLPPVEYASGKTDTLVYMGLKKGDPAEKNMLAAMEIQGQLYEGKSFQEIDEKLYFDLPQLCEDEPLFAVMLDLRYRYFLEKEEYEKAADCLNRLAQAQAYLPEHEVEKLAAELTYMHALRGDFESAEASGKLCRAYLQSDEAAAKRTLLAFSKAFGKEESIAPLKEQLAECLENERIAGVKKFEELLCSRI